jgi:hypothetical protein
MPNLHAQWGLLSEQLLEVISERDQAVRIALAKLWTEDKRTAEQLETVRLLRQQVDDMEFRIDDFLDTHLFKQVRE